MKIVPASFVSARPYGADIAQLSRRWRYMRDGCALQANVVLVIEGSAFGAWFIIGMQYAASKLMRAASDNARLNNAGSPGDLPDKSTGFWNVVPTVVRSLPVPTSPFCYPATQTSGTGDASPHAVASGTRRYLFRDLRFFGLSTQQRCIPRGRAVSADVFRASIAELSHRGHV